LYIYYEYSSQTGVQVTYDLNKERVYDYFSNMSSFYGWAHHEFHHAELIEITDDNYRKLAEQGAI